MANPAPKPPDARRRRRDVSASQAAHRLPITGRQGAPPKSPVRLGAAGRRWWRWAWSTPQATTWNAGFIEPLAKRAQLEDQWVTALEGDADGDQRATDTAVRLLPLILRMDDAFGLTPTSAAKLHYAFVADEPVQDVPTSAGVTDIRNRLKGMRD
jgi:hypothetical protein